MRTVSISVTLTGPEDTLQRLASTLGVTAIDWDVEAVTAVAEVKADAEPIITDCPITIDTRSRQLLVQAVEVPTTKREFGLLLFLAEHPGEAFTRQEIMQAVWGHDKTGQRTVDVHVRRLRTKLGKFEQHLATVHGYGYRLDANVVSVQ
jgi:two-component system, OmpR family, response regulator